MNKKTLNEFIDHGCGFPVVLKNVPMKKFQGKWIPDINYNALEKNVLILLCHKPFKLTGHEIRFIRLYFEMTLQEFAKRFGVQHPTVIKWEKFKNHPTNMTMGTEKDIRLFIIGNLIGKRKIADLYNELEQNPFGSKNSIESLHPIEVDMERIAI